MPILIRTDTFITRDFRAGEMACRCRRPDCDALTEPDMAFMAKLQRVRDIWGVPMTVDSGVRCQLWNKLKGGAPDSQHLLYRAVDILVTGLDERDRLELVARRCGMKGIGLGRTFLHMDDRHGRAATWTYPLK